MSNLKQAPPTVINFEANPSFWAGNQTKSDNFVEAKSRENLAEKFFDAGASSMERYEKVLDDRIRENILNSNGLEGKMSESEALVPGLEQQNLVQKKNR